MNLPKPDTAVRLAEQTEALDLYLEALFAVKPASLPVPVIRPAPIAQRVIDLPVTRVEAEAPTVAVVAPPAAKVVTPPPPVAPCPVVAPAASPTESPIPDWAVEPFPCLLLKVQGLSLALPLVKLHRILPWSEPTPIPGYAAWLLGLLPLDGQDRALRVVDTSGLVMPERAIAPSDRIPPRHIVMVGEGEWGLTCEDVSSVITIAPHQVRWRSERTKRPWLAGTVVEHLCALLDAEKLADLLSKNTPDLPV